MKASGSQPGSICTWLAVQQTTLESITRWDKVGWEVEKLLPTAEQPGSLLCPPSLGLLTHSRETSAEPALGTATARALESGVSRRCPRDVEGHPTSGSEGALRRDPPADGPGSAVLQECSGSHERHFKISSSYIYKGVSDGYLQNIFIYPLHLKYEHVNKQSI